MHTVALLGARGLVGSLIGEELVSRGLAVVVLGRDEPRMPASFAGCDLVIDAAGHTPEGAASLLRAVCRAGIDLVDVSPSQAHVHAVHQTQAVVVDAGVRVIAGAGFQHLIGDALAHLAGTASPAPREVHIAYTLPGRGAMLAAASPGRRRSAADALLAPSLAYVHGALVEEPIGEQRRLAWFPRPVGPSHAAAVPGGEAISVPQHLPGVDTVRTYLALAGWRSELLQFVANLARVERPREVLRRRVMRPRGTFGEARRRAIRWGCVAEAGGPGGVARAWAYGHDPYRLTAVAAVTCAETLLADGPGPGVIAPARVRPPGDLLDALAARTDLRWSIKRPEPPASAPS